MNARVIKPSKKFERHKPDVFFMFGYFCIAWVVLEFDTWIIISVLR